jgi:hypothetical protein
VEITAGRKRSIGLTAGVIWLIVISLVFVVLSLLAIETPAARNVLIVTLTIAAAFIIACIVVLRAVLGLPRSIIPPASEEKKLGSRFALIVGLEGFAFAIVNSILGATRNFELIPSLNLIIVGIHFFPLARLFQVPRYNITGLLFCAVPIVILLVIPKQFIVGNTLAWYVIPSLGCGLTASVTAIAGLYEAWKAISKIREGQKLVGDKQELE